MMNFFWPSRKAAAHDTVRWQASVSQPGVKYAVRRASLGERLALTSRLRELCQREEFLRAGDSAEQLDAVWGELLVKRAYLEWGLLAVRGLRIDGKKGTPGLLMEAGPESLTDEILSAIQGELGLTDDERKNS